MAVTIHLNGKSLSLAHKGCSGITKCTLPDVCKTPSPGGPVPIPYPVIISRAGSLKKGTKTIKVDGGNMAANKGSEYSTCNGDEAGTAGGVKSSTNMKEATWILYSFDVKLEGKNACRLSDKMMMNHANTACLGGTIHAPVPKLDSCDEAGLRKLACKCNRTINCSPEDGGPCPEKPHGNAKTNPGGSDCTTLGTTKHTCCELAIKKHAEENPECGFKSEVVFPEGAKNSKEAAQEAYKKKYDEYTDPKRKPRPLTDAQAKGYLRRDEVYTKALYDNGADFIADVVQGDPPQAAYDFKFACKEKGTEKIGEKQRGKYKKWLKDADGESIEPTPIHEDGSDCNCDNKECE